MNSGVCNYLEFKSIEKLYYKSEADSAIYPVPCSKTEGKGSDRILCVCMCVCLCSQVREKERDEEQKEEERERGREVDKGRERAGEKKREKESWSVVDAR